MAIKFIRGLLARKATTIPGVPGPNDVLWLSVGHGPDDEVSVPEGWELWSRDAKGSVWFKKNP